MKETFFFSHDYNARTDPKIKDLLTEHGMLGYGIFWAIIEDLYNNSNVLRLNYKTISYDLRTDPDTIKSIINDFGLFIIDGDNFSSKSVGERLQKRTEKSIKASESIKKRWEKYERNTNVSGSKNDSNTNKVKESKGKERINIEFDVFYEAYGKKVEKDKASKKWTTLTDEERELALADAPKYRATITDIKYQKSPLVYLNGKNWLDERSVHPLPTTSNLKRVTLNDKYAS